MAAFLHVWAQATGCSLTPADYWTLTVDEVAAMESYAVKVLRERRALMNKKGR